MTALPVSTGLQAERICCDGLCNQGRDCPLRDAPGLLGSKPVSAEQPLTQGQRIAVGVVAVAVVVLFAVAVFGVGYLAGSAHPILPKPARVMT